MAARTLPPALSEAAVAAPRKLEVTVLRSIGERVQTVATVKGLLFLLLMSAQIACGQPAQIILLRHAEKPADPTATHLSAKGSERAQRLASFLGRASTLTSNAAVTALFATRVTKNGNGLRPGETLAPLAVELGLTVQTPFESEEYELLAHRILAEPEYRGKSVIICWTHHDIAALAKTLGVKSKPPRWQDEVFDRVWVIKLRNGKAKLRDLPQDLLPGDAKK